MEWVCGGEKNWIGGKEVKLLRFGNWLLVSGDRDGKK